MSWRPKNWDEIKPRKFFGQASTEAGFQIESNQFKLGVEAGADAILEALKNGGVFTYGHHTPDIDLNDAPEVSGYWVFIPEEEV